jgi:hypothetical protein
MHHTQHLIHHITIHHALYRSPCCIGTARSSTSSHTPCTIHHTLYSPCRYGEILNIIFVTLILYSHTISLSLLHRYGEILNIIFVTLLFSSFIPLLNILAVANFIGIYTVDKVTSSPPSLTSPSSLSPPPLTPPLISTSHSYLSPTPPLISTPTPPPTTPHSTLPTPRWPFCGCTRGRNYTMRRSPPSHPRS